jgi:uncharacterized protein (DUF1501 family)
MTGFSRRTLLSRGLGTACCLAAAPLVTPVTLAATPGENRLVVIVLRGALDGLGAFPPLDDPLLAELRPSLAAAGAPLELDGRFGMHPALAPLLPLWRRGELAVAHAVATPYRDKRSHFDGQDLLESGMVAPDQVHDGWLNRALAGIPGARVETALSVGREGMLLLRGAQAVQAWSPGVSLALRNDERGLLERLYRDDPLFRDAALAAESLSGLEAEDDPAGRKIDPIAQFAGERLAAEARIAAFSIGGWDTHRGQAKAIERPLKRLARAILTLEASIGPAWDRTLVVAMTEFGRTVRENGSGGTDHGTGGAALLAGGVLNGGRVLGRWPGLAEGELYQGRDLMPTADVRGYPAWALAELFGLDRARIEREIFPSLDMGSRPDFLA